MSENWKWSGRRETKWAGMLLKVAWDEERTEKRLVTCVQFAVKDFLRFSGEHKRFSRGKKKRPNESYEWTEAHYLIQTNWYHRLAACSRSQHTSTRPRNAITLAMNELQLRETSKRTRNARRNRRRIFHLTEKQKLVYTIINIIQQARRRSGRTKKPPQVFISLVNRRWKWNIALDMFTKWMKKEAPTKHSRNTNWNIIHAFVVLLLLVNLAPILIS